MIWGCGAALIGCTAFVIYCTANVIFRTANVVFRTANVGYCTAIDGFLPLEVFGSGKAVELTGELQRDAHVLVDVPAIAVDNAPSSALSSALVLNEPQVFENFYVPDDGGSCQLQLLGDGRNGDLAVVIDDDADNGGAVSVSVNESRDSCMVGFHNKGLGLRV